MKNTQSRIKPIKTGRKIGTVYCLGCEDCTHNFKPQEIKMTNNNINRQTQQVAKIIILNYKKIHMYYKNCKKHTGNTFPKKKKINPYFKK